MRLTKHSDYALRVLLYAAAYPERLVSTEEISRAYEISNHHLVKVVALLSKRGYLEVKRGRSGGLRLALPPQEITVGEVVRATEPDFAIVECFDPQRNTCPIVKVCTLIKPLAEARDAFIGVLDGYTLADLLGPQALPRYRQLFTTLSP